jgi:hypothetical protein
MSSKEVGYSNAKVPDVEEGSIAPTAPQDVDVDSSLMMVATLATTLGRLREMEAWMDRKMGAEQSAIARVPESQRHPPSIWNVSGTCFLRRVVPMIAFSG